MFHRYLCVQGVGISGPMSFPGGYVGGEAGGYSPPGHGIQWDTIGKQAVRILLQYFLVLFFLHIPQKMQRIFKTL